MKKSLLCADGCMVAEARGAHCACTKECAYADDDGSIEADADREMFGEDVENFGLENVGNK